MKKSLLFIIISMAFVFAGADAIAQDTKHTYPRYLELDAEAVRVVMKSPKWEPGKKDGKHVMFYFGN